MKLIINEDTDPAFNLALEEYLLTQTDMDVIVLWRNDKSVIIGRNQNAAEELDIDYIKANDVTVIRRQSGGGAVFHDLGNINFTVIHQLADNDFSNYAKFTAPICAFLQTLGVKAGLEGRNDLLIDGQKFSGNAQAVRRNRIMHHGTILYNADLSKLSAALKPRESKIASKAIKSVRARVTNVASHMRSPMAVEDFFNKLAEYFRENVENINEYELSPEDIEKTRELVKNKYSKWEWNFGESPDYSFENSIKFPFGLIDLKLKVSSGIIENVHIFGDYFGILDKSELEEKIKNIRHDREAIADAVNGLDLQKYIHGITEGEFLDLF